jgi:hypothetical protein
VQLLMRRIRPDEVEQEVTQRDQFDTDMVGLAETLVRETHQNSVDGRLRGSAAPVYTRIALRQSRPEDSDRWTELLMPLSPHLVAAGIDVSTLNLRSPSFLVIEDFGTTGLVGAVDSKDDKNFSDFWRRTGRSHKKGAQAGRWGLGKLVYSSASRIRTFFGLTVRSNDPGRPYLMGQAVLRHHEIGGIDYAPHGFFAVSSDTGLQLPTEDPQLIAWFRDATGVARTTEPGLSVVVPFPQADLSPLAMLPYVVRNWFFPILTGQLIVQLDDTSIDRQSFPALAMEHGGQAFQNGHLVRFITELEVLHHDSPALVAEERWPVVGLSEAISGAALAKLREDFAHGRLVSLRLPLTLRTKAAGVRTSYVDVHLQSHTDALSSEAIFVRGALTIPGEARRFRGRSCYGALIASEAAVVEFLGDAENPAHTSWSGSAEKVRENWKNAGERLKEIRNALNHFYEAIAQPLDREEADALIGIFHVPDKAAADRPKPQRPEVRHHKVPQIKRSPAQFRIDPRKGGFAVRSTADTSLPLELRLRLAYDVVAGDPLKRYDPLDFDLVRTSEIQIESKGAVPHIIGPNELRIEVHATEFALVATGFDLRRDVFIRADRVQ